jgi:hypothetical protein
MIENSGECKESSVRSHAGLRKQRHARGVAVKKIGSAHWPNLTLRKKPGDRNIPGPLTNHGHIVVGAAEKPSPATTTTEQQRAQRGGGLTRPVRSQHEVEILARGLRVANMELDGLPFRKNIADGQAAGTSISSDQISDKEITALKPVALFIHHDADVQGSLCQVSVMAAQRLKHLSELVQGRETA